MQLKEHEAWSGAVLKENADFAALASTYLPGKESQELDQTWPVMSLCVFVVYGVWVWGVGDGEMSELVCLCTMCVVRHGTV